VVVQLTTWVIFKLTPSQRQVKKSSFVKNFNIAGACCG